MNLRRGLFRAWVVFSLCYVLFVFFVFFDDLRLITVHSLLQPNEFDPDAYLAGAQYLNPWILLAKVVTVGLIPPLIVLAAGAALLWAGYGFRSNRNSN
jgi:hypothetical protein